MSTQSVPLTYEGVLEMFRETDRKFQETREYIQEVARRQAETDRQMKETDRLMKETDRRVGALTSRIGEIVENMVGGDIVGQFQALNIAIKWHSRDRTFGTRGTNESGQIDVFLENGDLVILIEVKTKLTEDDICEHIERMQKYRRCGDDKRRILGAVAGAVVSDDVVKFAHSQGLYVIVQSGEAVEIITPPEGFRAKEW